MGRQNKEIVNILVNKEHYYLILNEKVFDMKKCYWLDDDKIANHIEDCNYCNNCKTSYPK